MLKLVTKKDRRHSGYVTPQITSSPKELKRHNLSIKDFYDDWENYRDGFRDWFRDFKLIKKRKRFFNAELSAKRIRMNLKQKRLLQRRKQRKEKKWPSQANS